MKYIIWLMEAISRVMGLGVPARRCQREVLSFGREAKNWAVASGVSSASLGVLSSRMTLSCCIGIIISQELMCSGMWDVFFKSKILNRVGYFL